MAKQRASTARGEANRGPGLDCDNIEFLDEPRCALTAVRSSAVVTKGSIHSFESRLRTTDSFRSSLPPSSRCLKYLACEVFLRADSFAAIAD